MRAAVKATKDAPVTKLDVVTAEDARHGVLSEAARLASACISGAGGDEART